jgi:uncharacterized protein (TIGR03435 family)
MQYAPGSATATGNAVSISTLLTLLRQEAGRPIADKTNLQGLYDFKLHSAGAHVDSFMVPEHVRRTGGPGGTINEPVAAADPVSTLFTAIQEQLGLKLESALRAC